MDYVTMGRSGLKVSRACLGTMNFGSGDHPLAGCGEGEAAQIIGAFLDRGNNFVDTADAYTGGQSEEVVGRAIKGRRDEVVLATKGFMRQGHGPNHRGLSRAHLTRALEASLLRLGTDHIDLYQCHGWDDTTPIEETMATLDGFVRSGKVRYIGCSNFTAAQIVEAQWAADRAGTTPFISLQPQYSLIARSIEAEILPTCERHGLGTLVYSPLGSGVLTGRYGRDNDPDEDSRLGRFLKAGIPAARTWAQELLSDRNLDIVEEVRTVAAELGTTSTAVALAWVRQRPGVTSVIIGPRTPEQLDGALASLTLDLPAETLARLDEVSQTTTIPLVNGVNDPTRPAATRPGRS
ncbi:aldo/keto reductase [Planotetraspora silvatica]|uniref:Aldo/keto reductase n=1 Tax=Planotetraspora silvatica TaxID=234614 RepID=A0A8J3V6P2_9ACTN|nr:aldo/keto reductase [Planotetraspora silvatica]GII50985.1 aldo/keto reductase [Planotetraspora silvatica]